MAIMTRELSAVSRLGRDPVEVGRAREMVRKALPGWGIAEHTGLAELIVSELVTNAVQESCLALPSSAGPGRVLFSCSANSTPTTCRYNASSAMSDPDVKVAVAVQGAAGTQAPPFTPFGLLQVAQAGQGAPATCSPPARRR